MQYNAAKLASAMKQQSCAVAEYIRQICKIDNLGHDGAKVKINSMLREPVFECLPCYENLGGQLPPPSDESQRGRFSWATEKQTAAETNVSYNRFTAGTIRSEITGNQGNEPGMSNLVVLQNKFLKG